MSRNLGLHLHYVSIIKSPEKFETIIRDYLKQKQLKHVTTEITNKELKKTKPRDRFFSLLNKWLQIKAKYYDARKAQKLIKNTQQTEVTCKTELSSVTNKTFTIANTLDKIAPRAPRLDYQMTNMLHAKPLGSSNQKLFRCKSDEFNPKQMEMANKERHKQNLFK